MKTTRRNFFGLASLPFLAPLFRNVRKQPDLPVVEFDEEGNINNIEELWNKAIQLDTFEKWYEFSGSYRYRNDELDELRENFDLLKNMNERGITVFSPRYIISGTDCIVGTINLNIRLGENSGYILAIPHKNSTILSAFPNFYTTQVKFQN